MMTRKTFEQRAIRAEERRLHLPAGWWGTYCDNYGPHGERVLLTGHHRWSVTLNRKRIGVYENREAALRKARRLVPR